MAAPAAGTGQAAPAAGTSAAGVSGTSTGTAGSPAAGSGGTGTAGTKAGSGGAGTGSTAGAGTGGASGTANAAAGTGGASGTGNASGSGGASAADPFQACVAALKPQCKYDDKETPCSSVMTAEIPLSDGSKWGNVEIKGGPYGAYVAFNQGEAFKNPVNASESSCELIASSFGEPASVTADVLDLRGGDLSLYTVFRPACMKEGEKYPVITWGNGTCGQSGGYASFLASVASYGFVVFASNSRFTDGGNNEMLHALDFAKAENDNMMSPLYQHLDLDKVGAMGHSQGGSATANAARDPRIKALIIWNSGLTATKPYLTVSGERDITGYTAQSMASGVNGASQPGAWLFFHKVLMTGGSVTGHLTLMEQPERVVEPTVAWWKYILSGDAEAKKMFVGDDCGLCTHKDDYEYGSNGKLP